MKSNNNIFLTGQAGTGKSTTIKNYIKWAEENGIIVGLTASTGIAAVNIGGVTIHTFLGSKIANSIEEYKKIKISATYKEALEKGMKIIDVLVIDEVSMLTATYIDMIDYILKTNTGEKNLPFGGKKIIFTGDFLQLPPVEKGERKFAFESEAWKNANVKTYNLTKIHRQADENFTHHLSKVRVGLADEETIEYFQSINKKEDDDSSDGVKLFSRNINVDEYNEKKLDLIQGESKFYDAVLTGSSAEKEIIKKRVLANERLELKIGAKVMALKNESDLKYVNGSTGIVINLYEDSVKVKFDNGYVCNIVPKTWENLDINRKILSTFEQIPLKLAYAITIHKSQGMTIDNLVVNCDGIFEKGQFYVAVSRARTKEGLKLINFMPKNIVADQKAVEFYKKFDK